MRHSRATVILKDIDTIVIIGDEKWRAHGLACAGAGIRKAAVRSFPPGGERPGARLAPGS